jgi:NitT/TauT family transport system permease protein
VGLGLGIVGSVPIVGLISVSRFTERTFQPIIDFIYSIPKVALIPVLVLTFGVGRVSEIFLIFLFVVFIFVYNFRAGLREVDPRLLNAMKNLGMSQIGLILNVRIPVLLSYGMAGLRIGISTAITGAIFAEYFSGEAGIGKLIYQSAISYQMDSLIAGVAALVPVTYAFDILLRRLDSRLSAWRSGL